MPGEKRKKGVQSAAMTGMMTTSMRIHAKIEVAKKWAACSFVVPLHTAMYSLAAQWRKRKQRKIKAKQEQQNQRVCRTAHWIARDEKTIENSKHVAHEDEIRECRQKIIPGYHFVLTIASPPKT